MTQLLPDVPEALSNTQDFAKKCNLDLKLKNIEIKNKHTGEVILEHSPATPPSFKYTQEYAKNLNLPDTSTARR